MPTAPWTWTSQQVENPRPPPGENGMFWLTLTPRGGGPVQVNTRAAFTMEVLFSDNKLNVLLYLYIPPGPLYPGNAGSKNSSHTPRDRILSPGDISSRRIPAARSRR
jgi:hypothetical protein